MNTSPVYGESESGKYINPTLLMSVESSTGLEHPTINKSEVINNIFVFMILVLWFSFEYINLQEVTLRNTKPH